MPDYAAIERKLDERITQGEPDLTTVRAILVSVDGETVIDHYRSSDASEYAHVWSVTKTVMSILVGIALGEGHLSSTDQTLEELLPKYRARMTEQIAGITLRQLLTHTAGLPGLDSPSVLDLAGDDVVGQILDDGLINDPGITFTYTNTGVHLIGAVLAEATGQSVLDYARTRLFEPLGIKTTPAYEGFDALDSKSKFHDNQFAWAADRQGIHTGCCGLKLTAPDMIKIGQLYLKGGTWEGRRIVPADWVRESTTPHVTAEQLAPDGGYGYLWWLAEQRGHQGYAAVGAFGQLILVVSDLNLVIAISSRDDQKLDIALKPLIDLVVAELE